MDCLVGLNYSKNDILIIAARTTLLQTYRLIPFVVLVKKAVALFWIVCIYICKSSGVFPSRDICEDHGRYMMLSL